MMIENFEKKKYESFGIDLHDFCKETMIKRFENVQVTGINVLVLIYKGPIKVKSAGGIFIPEIAQKTDLEYNSMVGMVLKVGSDAYKGEQFPSGPYAKVGDWVIFPRGSSLQAKYEDEPIIMVEDFKIKLIVEDPSKVSR